MVDQNHLNVLRGNGPGWHGFPWYSWTNFWVIGGQTFLVYAILNLIECF